MNISFNFINILTERVMEKGEHFLYLEMKFNFDNCFDAVITKGSKMTWNSADCVASLFIDINANITLSD